MKCVSGSSGKCVIYMIERSEESLRRQVARKGWTGAEKGDSLGLCAAPTPSRISDNHNSQSRWNLLHIHHSPSAPCDR